MKKVIDFFKRFGKYIMWALALIGGLIIVGRIRKAIRGKVQNHELRNYAEVPGEPNKIKLIKKDGSTETVKLPDGVKFKEVAAAGITEGGEIKVEVLHDKTNRRGSTDTDYVPDNALDSLRTKPISATDPTGG